MEVWKKIGKALLFPRISVIIIITPLSAAFLIYSMLVIGTENILSYISYTLAAYTLTVWCIQLPTVIKCCNKFKNENKYLVKWREDVRLRVRASLWGTFILNISYAALQLGLGLYHSSFWFYSIAGYYASLAVMRLFLVRHTGRHMPGEQMHAELIRYRTCGWVFLAMNLALTLMIFFMVYWNRTFIHHEITTIVMAAYTFTTFTFAIINIIKYKKYNSPVFSASKAISLAAACVSMLTLTSTMLTTFGEGESDAAMRRAMLGSVGGVISAFIIAMAVYMIIKGTKKLREEKET